jgi:hypothetical protein
VNLERALDDDRHRVIVLATHIYLTGFLLSSASAAPTLQSILAVLSIGPIFSFLAFPAVLLLHRWRDVSCGALCGCCLPRPLRIRI